MCTGRTPTDIPDTPSYPRSNSCLDHALVSPSLFPHILSCGVLPARPDSDNSPLHLQLPILPPQLPRPAPPPDSAKFPVSCWKWDSNKQPIYANAMQTAAANSAYSTVVTQLQRTSKQQTVSSIQQSQQQLRLAAFARKSHQPTAHPAKHTPPGGTMTSTLSTTLSTSCGTQPSVLTLVHPTPFASCKNCKPP